MPIGYWYRGQYESHWREALQSLVAGAPTAVLMTWVSGPPDEHNLSGWPLYREGEVVYAQNMVMVPGITEPPLDLAHPERSVGSRESVLAIAPGISEWTCSVADIAGFLTGNLREAGVHHAPTTPGVERVDGAIDLTTLPDFAGSTVDLRFANGHAVRGRLLAVSLTEPREIIYTIWEVHEVGPAEWVHLTHDLIVVADPTHLVSIQRVD